MLKNAIEIAIKAHLGQMDQSGKPFINHTMRVMKRLTDKQERICGVLHDVVEGTNVSMSDLEGMGFDRSLLQIVDSQMRRPEEPEEEYEKRILNNPVAARVKLADLEDIIENPGVLHADASLQDIVDFAARIKNKLSEMGERLS